MKSFFRFLTEKALSNAEILKTSSDAAYIMFAAGIDAIGYDIDKDFPNFKKGYDIIKKRLSFGKYLRKQMPVVKSVDFERFKKYMVRDHNTKTTKKTATPMSLMPIQKTLRLDNAIDAMKKYGLKNNLKFIRGDSHTVISKDGFIMDGNHRWMLAMLIDPQMKIKVNVVDMEADQLKLAMDHYTDKIIRRNRNESILSR